MEKIVAIIYALSVTVDIALFFRIKKSEKRLPAVSFLFISIFIFFCYQTVVAALLSIFHITVSNLSISIVNWIVGLVMYYLIKYRNYIQKYICDKKDCLAILVLVISVLIISGIQFGWHFNMYNYECLWDSSVHVQYARKMAQDHELNTLYFVALNMGLWLESLYAFDPFATGCTMFIWSDIITLFMSAVMFWNLVKNHICSKYLYIIGIIISIAYIYGYPLNNMVFGTSYLGVGNVCVLYLLMLMEMHKDEKLLPKPFFTMIIAGVFGLIVSYILFAPVILLTIFCYLVSHYYKNGILTRKVVTIGAIISILIVIIGIVCFYIFYWDSMSGLALEGQIYRNFFSNFVIFLPFILMLWNKKNIKENITIFASSTLIYVLIFMCGIFLKKISGYYYFKNYYLLWIVCCYSVIFVISKYEEYRGFINRYLLSCFFLFMLWKMDVSTILSQSTDGYYGEVFGEVSTDNLFDIYNFNINAAKHVVVEPGTREIFLEVASMNRYIDGDVCFVGDCRFALQKQFAAIANQPDIDYFVASNSEEYIQIIKDNSQYVCVVDPDLAPFDINEYLSTLEVIYTNSKGYIAKVK